MNKLTVSTVAWIAFGLLILGMLITQTYTEMQAH